MRQHPATVDTHAHSWERASRDHSVDTPSVRPPQRLSQWMTLARWHAGALMRGYSAVERDQKPTSACGAQEGGALWSAIGGPVMHQEVNAGGGANISDGVTGRGDMRYCRSRGTVGVEARAAAKMPPRAQARMCRPASADLRVDLVSNCACKRLNATRCFP